MFKRIKNEPVASLLLAVLLVVFMAAAAWNMSITRFDSLWVGDTDDTSNATVGDDDAYIKGTLEVDGAVRLDGGLTLTSTGEITAINIADVVRYYQLPLMAFVGNADEAVSANGSVLSTATVPGFEIDDGLPNLVWADGEVSCGMVTFRVPADYVSGGLFKVLATESDSTTPNQVDFNVLVNANATAIDTTMTGQTPVALTSNTSTPSEITLTVATDFAALAAGHWVTLRIWRDNTAAGTGDLEVKGVAFYYTATQ